MHAAAAPSLVEGKAMAGAPAALQLPPASPGRHARCQARLRSLTPHLLCNAPSVLPSVSTCLSGSHFCQEP